MTRANVLLLCSDDPRILTERQGDCHAFFVFFSRKRRANLNPRANKKIETALIFGHFFGVAAGTATRCGVAEVSLVFVASDSRNSGQAESRPSGAVTTMLACGAGGRTQAGVAPASRLQESSKDKDRKPRLALPFSLITPLQATKKPAPVHWTGAGQNVLGSINGGGDTRSSPTRLLQPPAMPAWSVRVRS